MQEEEKEEEMTRDPEYMAWIREQSCCVRTVECSGSIQAHHTAHAYISTKGDDSSCIPLCHHHHMLAHQKSRFKERFGFDPDVTYSKRYYYSFTQGKRRVVPQHSYDERQCV